MRYSRPNSSVLFWLPVGGPAVNLIEDVAFVERSPGPFGLVLGNHFLLPFWVQLRHLTADLLDGAGKGLELAWEILPLPTATL